MSNVQRYVRGPQKVAKGKIQAGVVAEIGDLVALLNNYIVPAKYFGVAGTTKAAESAFRGDFLGVLISGATTGKETSDTDCLVGYDAVYRFPIASLASAVEPGQKVSAYDQGTVLANQQVATTSAVNASIGQVADHANAGETQVHVQIVSVIMGGGIQAPAA